MKNYQGTLFWANSYIRTTKYIYFFINNYGQTLALKVAYIFKIFKAQSCLMVALQFDQINKL